MTTPPKNAHDFDDDDEPPQVTPEASLAADDPTTVWDADALRAAGLDDMAERPEERELPPATASDRDNGPSSIVTPLTEDEDEEDGTVAMDGMPVQHAAPREEGSGWGRTLLLALVLGTAVYFAVRYLR